MKTLFGLRRFINLPILINMNLQECVEIMSDFINEHPDVWNEDVGC